MPSAFTNRDYVIDSRDIIQRIEELESDIEDMPCTCEPGALDEDGCTCTTEDKRQRWMQEYRPLAVELASLHSLAEQGREAAADWQYGETLIRDDHFETYAQELAEETGMVKENAAWPYTCIDWTEAARQLQQDYTSVDYDGVTYWIR